MSMNTYYPIIKTDKLIESINFYEDYFGFVPELEMECFAVMTHSENGARIGFITHDYHALPEHQKSAAQGLILNFPVKNVNESYKDMYLEGLDLHAQPALAPCGRRHFFVEDPNGILIDVMEDFDPFAGFKRQ